MIESTSLRCVSPAFIFIAVLTNLVSYSIQFFYQLWVLFSFRFGFHFDFIQKEEKKKTRWMKRLRNSPKQLAPRES